MNQRYKRQINLKDVGIIGQEKLNGAKVLVVGAGGLGCPVLSYMTTMGIGSIGICDYDLVDETNLHRQPLFDTEDIGKKKSIVAAKKLKKLNPETIVTIHDCKLNIESGLKIIKEYDLVIDCTDNFKTKFLIHDLCYSSKTDLVQASIYQYDGILNVFNFKKQSGPCLRCLWPTEPVDGCVGNCVEAGVLGVLPGVLGTLQATEAVKLILGLPTLAMGTNLMVDLISMEMDRVSWTQNSNCQNCNELEENNILDKYLENSLGEFEVQFKKINDPKEYIWFDIRGLDEINNSSYQMDPSINVKKYLESKDLNFSTDNNYIFFCLKGIRSQKLVSELRSKGVNAYSLAGGLEECI